MDFDDPDHINGSVDMAFNEVATDSGRVDPSWTVGAATCSNTYCHGAFAFRRDVSDNPLAYVDTVIAGNNVTMDWTVVGEGLADCGTCHDLPPKGHISVATCDGCHGDVVDSEFNIINPDLHINGLYDVGGISYRP
jgi:predicted CxxxxCH...CXXCH cytochrome family protein